MQWYYAVSGQRFGPVAQTEFEQLVRDGAIKADTLVWHDGMSAWQPYGSISSPPASAPAAMALPHVAPRAGDFSYGGFWRPFVAKLLDVIILSVVGMAINMVVALALYGTGAVTTDGSQLPMATIFMAQGLSLFGSIAVGLLYGVFFIRRFNATPGKMALGLQLIRPDGAPLSIGRIIGRYFAEWLSGFILLIGYIIAAFDDERRALHDHICDTRVIKVR